MYSLRHLKWMGIQSQLKNRQKDVSTLCTSSEYIGWSHGIRFTTSADNRVSEDVFAASRSTRQTVECIRTGVSGTVIHFSCVVSLLVDVEVSVWKQSFKFRTIYSTQVIHTAS